MAGHANYAWAPFGSPSTFRRFIRDGVCMFERKKRNEEFGKHEHFSRHITDSDSCAKGDGVVADGGILPHPEGYGRDGGVG